MEIIRTLRIATFLAFILSPPLYAQQTHAVDQVVLNQAIAAHVRETADDREAILQVLRLERVRELAGRAGLDLKRAETAVSTLHAEEISVLAAQARAVNASLVGGQSSVTISTTTIIIGLLVLILIIVAV